MATSADLKVERAAKHIVQLNELLKVSRPFRYVFEIDAQTGECATFSKKNQPVINEAALICGDVVHNLRAALDHAYWDRVSPFATTEKERRNVQFPFCKEAARLDEAVRNRLADRVSPTFFKALVDLKPHGETGGNELLYLIDQLDVLDKHKLLVPTADYKRLSGEMLMRLIPGFPVMFRGMGGFGNNAKDIAWQAQPVAGMTGKLEKELDVPVDIIFTVGDAGRLRPVIPTLHQLVDVARTTINIIRTA